MRGNSRPITITTWYKARGGEDPTEVLTLAHELLCTRSHTRAQSTRPHFHMLPLTSRIGPTREHCTSTSSFHSYIEQSARVRSLHRSPHSHARSHVRVPPARTHFHARIARKACGRIPHENTCSRTRAILVSCTDTVRSVGASTHVAPNKVLSHAHMLGTRGRTRTLPQYMPVLPVPFKARTTPISTHTNSAHVPKYAHNAVD